MRLATSITTKSNIQNLSNGIDYLQTAGMEKQPT
jgi:hypothetical protein